MAYYHVNVYIEDPRDEDEVQDIIDRVVGEAGIAVLNVDVNEVNE